MALGGGAAATWAIQAAPPAPQIQLAAAPALAWAARSTFSVASVLWAMRAASVVQFDGGERPAGAPAAEPARAAPAIRRRNRNRSRAGTISPRWCGPRPPSPRGSRLGIDHLFSVQFPRASSTGLSREPVQFTREIASSRRAPFPLAAPDAGGARGGAPGLDAVAARANRARAAAGGSSFEGTLDLHATAAALAARANRASGACTGNGARPRPPPPFAAHTRSTCAHARAAEGGGGRVGVGAAGEQAQAPPAPPPARPKQPPVRDTDEGTHKRLAKGK